MRWDPNREGRDVIMASDGDKNRTVGNAPVGSARQERRGFDSRAMRAAFPALHREVHPGKPLVYLDSAATAPKPQAVLDAVRRYDAEFPANVHRGIHTLAEEATEAYEAARATVAAWLGSTDPLGDASRVVFVKNATEALNLVALGWAGSRLEKGDEVVLTVAEHHANLVPWRMLAERRGVTLRYADLDAEGRLTFEAVEAVVSERTRVLAVTGLSNILGTSLPVDRLVALGRSVGAAVVVDLAQAAGRLPAPVNGGWLEADFLAFSGHKLGGPTGVGVLVGRPERLEETEPILGGGGMIARVDLDAVTWTEPPHKFEAGTPPIAQAIGLAAAIDFLDQFDRVAIAAHEQRLAQRAARELAALDGVRLVGAGADRVERHGIVSFVCDAVHPHDLAQWADADGVAIRAGHHCGQPLHRRLGLTASARASFGPYNDDADVDCLIATVRSALARFGRHRATVAVGSHRIGTPR